MKTYLPKIVTILGLFIMMQSCIKESAKPTEKVNEIIIDTTIAAGSDFILSLAQYGNENDVATIVEPGKNFSISQLENIDDMFTTNYHYSAPSKFAGTDNITLSISGVSDNKNSCQKDSTVIYLNLTIK